MRTRNAIALIALTVGGFTAPLEAQTHYLDEYKERRDRREALELMERQTRIMERMERQDEEHRRQEAEYQRRLEDERVTEQLYRSIR